MNGFPFRSQFVTTADAGLRSPCIVGVVGGSRTVAPHPNAFLVSRGVRRTPPAVVGFTSPSGTYDRMRALQGDVLRLDANVDGSLPASSPFVAAWKAWRATWTPFYDKYAGPDAGTWTKLGAAFRSDALAADVDRFDAQFHSFLTEYGTLRNPQGAPLPGVLPTPALPAGPDHAELPWWFWAGTGAGAVGLGYLAYRRFWPHGRMGG